MSLVNNGLKVMNIIVYTSLLMQCHTQLCVQAIMCKHCVLNNKTISLALNFVHINWQREKGVWSVTCTKWLFRTN